MSLRPPTQSGGSNLCLLNKALLNGYMEIAASPSAPRNDAIVTLV